VIDCSQALRKAAILAAAAAALFVACPWATVTLGAENVTSTSPADDDTAPDPIGGDALEALLSSSPFTRSLGVSDSLILTGVAWYNHEVYATLLDTKTQASQVVCKTPNSEGWRLLEVGGDPEKLQTWTARIQIPGGEVVAIRYQPPPKRVAHGSSSSGSGGSSSHGSSNGGGNSTPISRAQEEEAQNAAVNYKEGFNSDGYPRQPPPEMVAKLSRLSVGQRADINRQMFGYRNQGLGMEDRRRIYENLVEKAGRR
jgi:hypothetical protein